jgi:hypothetical protein
MVPKHIFAAVIGIMALAWSGAALAAESGEYQPGEFFGLDLSKAVLSPKPLGPATQFAPVRIQAKTDPGVPAALTNAQPKAVSEVDVPKSVTPKIAPPKIAFPKAKIALLGASKPRGAGRPKLVRRHGNPLDAQALDTRIQVWPCRSGGICNWQR